MFDTSSLSEVREIQPNGENELTTHACSPCGSFIATGDDDGGVTLTTVSLAETQSKYDLEDEEEVTALSHATPSGGEPVLACATSEGRVRLLNASTAALINELTDPGAVSSVCAGFRPTQRHDPIVHPLTHPPTGIHPPTDPSTRLLTRPPTHTPTYPPTPLPTHSHTHPPCDHARKSMHPSIHTP